MARKHMAPPEASRSRSLRPLATTVPRRTEHPTKLAASVCPHRRHLTPSPRLRSGQGAKLQERSIGLWQREMAWLLSHPRSGTARKDPKANVAMMAPEQSPLRSRAATITRTLTLCNTRQRKISLSPAVPGLACRGRMPRFPPAPQSNLLRAVGYGQSEKNRKRSAKA